MYPIVKKEKLADKIYLMDVKAPRVAAVLRIRDSLSLSRLMSRGSVFRSQSVIITGKPVRSRSYFRRWELPHSVWYPWSRGMRSQISWDRLDVLLI